MASFVDDFPIRDSSPWTLSWAMSYAFAEYQAASSKAYTVLQFHNAALEAGVVGKLKTQMSETASEFVEEGFVLPGKENDFLEEFKAEAAAAYLVDVAHKACKLAASVLLHSAFERLLWCLCRIGTAISRKEVLSKLSERSIKLGTLIEQGQNAAEDALVEKWLNELKNDTCLKKWDEYIRLFGFPESIVDLPQWSFSKEYLVEFDSARHDAVHHSGDLLSKFDLDMFHNQASRATMVLIVHIYKKHGVSLLQEAAFGVQHLDKAFAKANEGRH
jgi:hypothetical protein